MSIRVLRSNVPGRNPNLREVPRKGNESNARWLTRILDEKLVDVGPDSSLLLLVGGADPLSFRLRIAQSHVRRDLTPSAWSHVAFVAAIDARLGASVTREVSLDPQGGFGRFGFAPRENGLQSGRLESYFDAKRYPNIALLCVSTAPADIAASLDDIARQRSVLDVPQLIVRWLTYVWGVGVPSSPLADGFGIPSSAVLEAAFAAHGFDLTPGLESRSSCPEAIWQSAGYWYQFHERAGEGKHIRGVFTAKGDLIPAWAM
jgi:hypothetical protein